MAGHRKDRPINEALEQWRQKKKDEALILKQASIDRISELVPSECRLQDNINTEISPKNCLLLCKALMEYVRSIPDCYSEADFLLDCTGFTGQFLSQRFLDADKWMENVSEEEKKVIKNAKRIYSRARDLCERHLIQNHTTANPQFAIFYAKNKFGYIDRTEQKTEQSGSISINLSIPMPNPPPKKLEDSTK